MTNTENLLQLVKNNKRKENIIMETIQEQLENAGYSYALAIATEVEINAGAACGQLAIINEEKIG